MTILDWLIIALYGAVMLWLGFRKRGQMSGNAVALILGGRTLTLPAFVATLVTTWYGGILGVGEFTYRYGIVNWLVFGLPYYLGAFVFAIVMARRARRSLAITIPDTMRAHFGPRSAFISALIVFFTAAPSSYILMLGILVGYYAGIPVWMGLLIGSAFTLAYIYLGGFETVVSTNVVQFILMFGGFALLLVVLAFNYGGWSFLSVALPATHLSPTGGNTLWYIVSWYFIAQGALVEPAFHQRCYAAKDESIARRGVLISIICWACFDFLTTACGLYAKALLPSLADPVFAFPALAALALPPGLLGLFVVAMLSVVMSTVQSYAFICAITYSHDIIKPLAKRSRDLARDTRQGLIITGVLSLAIAAYSNSIVEIWREFGSIAVAGLLAPLLIAFLDTRTLHRFGDRTGVALIVVPTLVTALWIIYKHVGPSGLYPFASHPFLAEPVFPGLYTSLSLYVIFLLVDKCNQMRVSA